MYWGLVTAIGLQTTIMMIGADTCWLFRPSSEPIHRDFIPFIKELTPHYTSNEALALVFSGIHFDVVTGYEGTIPVWSEIYSKFNANEMIMLGVRITQLGKKAQFFPVGGDNTRFLSRYGVPREGPPEHSVAEQANNPLTYKQDNLPVVRMLSRPIGDDRASTHPFATGEHDPGSRLRGLDMNLAPMVKHLFYRDSYLQRLNKTMSMSKYIICQCTTDSSGYACEAMLMKDFYPERDINFKRMITGGGEFGFDFLLHSGNFKHVDGDSDVFPRICKIIGHFIVVDAVDNEQIYFRDPIDATVRCISFDMVSYAKKSLGLDVNFNPFEEDRLVISGVALIESTGPR